MKIKNNFQRNIIMFVLIFFNNFCLAIPFLILKGIYNVSFLHHFIVAACFILYCSFFYIDYSKKLFTKYCNKECHNCNMWHCDFHFKDDKYVK